MRLYRCDAEGETRYVEAESFGEAVRLYMEAMVKRYGPGSGWDAPGAEPDSVELLSDHAVIR